MSLGREIWKLLTILSEGAFYLLFAGAILGWFDVTQLPAWLGYLWIAGAVVALVRVGVGLLVMGHRQW